jgi:hypothetical protein
MQAHALVLAAVLLPTLASAQPPRRPAQTQTQSGTRTEQAPPQTSAAAADLDDEESVDTGDASQRDVVEGGRRVRVFEFSGLDIAGRLRSPQLLYFLNRLRAEFDRPRLPHRSFMPELGRSTRSEAF